MLLARDVHDVTLLECDPQDPPYSADGAWLLWRRRGVPQFRQPHNLLPRYRAIVEHELPEVFAALEGAGATWVDMLGQLPPSLTDREPRAGDERVRYLTARRPTIEYAHARVAQATSRLTSRRRVRVEGLLVESGRGGIPHVIGVRTAGGELRADLVVDAMGHRSPLVSWLAAAGTRAPTVSPVGTLLILTMPGDNLTWSVTLRAPASDRPLREFRRPEKFINVVRACPLHAHWLDGEPITDVEVMGGILDRYLRFVVDDAPVATGFAAVGDAVACTNPSAGRGISVGMLHAQCLRDLLRARPDDPRDFAVRWDAVTEAELAPRYWAQLAPDQARLEQIDAVRDARAEAVPMCSVPCSRRSAALRCRKRCSLDRDCGRRCWPPRANPRRCRCHHARSCWRCSPEAVEYQRWLWTRVVGRRDCSWS
jgi:hypothetical protein